MHSASEITGTRWRLADFKSGVGAVALGIGLGSLFANVSRRRPGATDDSSAGTRRGPTTNRAPEIEISAVFVWFATVEDHDGGLAHFPHSEILVSPGELRSARGFIGRARGYLPQRWPTWFDPVALELAAGPYGPFVASARLTQAGDVIAVTTPGHTADHLSVAVVGGSITYFLAGDTSYNERLMLAGKVDGVSADDEVAERTLGAIRRFAAERPAVYLPTHDPESASPLANHQLVFE